MSEIRQLADGNVRSQQNSSDDDSTMVSALRKGELEFMVIRRVRDEIEPIFEPLIRRVVKEAIGSLQEWNLTRVNQNAGNFTYHSERRSMQLRILNKFCQPVLTGMKISVKINLVDVVTGEVVKFEPESSAQVEIVVLPVDPNGDEGHDWTPEEFNQKIVRTWEGKPLLTGTAFLCLKEGIGSSDEISFAHREKWMKKCQFRLGARIAADFNGIRVIEAKSEPFILKDRRNEYNNKHNSPSLSDDVWQLKNIGKRGPLAKRLREENIRTVKDFLIQYFINRQRLRDILGTGMPDKKFKAAVEHGLTGLTFKLDDFNAVGQVPGVLSETEVTDAQKLVVSAFEHTKDVVHYDENPLSCSSSYLPNALSPLNSPRQESCSGPDVGTSPHMIAGNDHMQPSTSSPAIIPFNNCDNGLVGFEILDMDFSFEPLEDLGQVPNHQMFDPMPIILDFEKYEQLWLPNNNRHLQFLNSSAEPQADQQTAENGFLLRRRFRTLSIALSIALKFSELKF